MKLGPSYRLVLNGFSTKLIFGLTRTSVAAASMISALEMSEMAEYAESGTEISEISRLWSNLGSSRVNGGFRCEKLLDEIGTVVENVICSSAFVNSGIGL